MKSTLKLEWHLFPWGYASDYSLRGAVPAGELALLADALINELLPAESLREQALTDIKGCDPLSELELVEGIAAPPHSSELFYLKGRIPFTQENEEGQEATGFHGFELRLLTSFLEFFGDQHIRYSVKLTRDGDLPDVVTLQQVAKVSQLEILYLRLGMEFFRSKYISGMFGFAPAVWQTLLLEATPAEFSLKISAEGLKNRQALPLTDSATMEKLDRILSKLYKFSLRQNYRELAS